MKSKNKTKDFRKFNNLFYSVFFQVFLMIQIRDAYLPFGVIDVPSVNSLAQLFGDRIIGYGVHRFVKFVSKFTDVYFQVYFRRTRQYFSLTPFRVHHIDDIQYLFITPFMGRPIFQTDPGNVIVERLIRIWAQFAGHSLNSS